MKKIFSPSPPKLFLHPISPTKGTNHFSSFSLTNQDPNKKPLHFKQILSRLLSDQQIDEARKLFSQIRSPDLHLYTMMINGYSKSNRFNEAFKLFEQMPVRDLPVWNTILKSCFNSGDLNRAFKLFGKMPERNVISFTTMINGLSQLGRINDAEKMFDEMPFRDTAAFNAMICGYLTNGRVADAQNLFVKMPKRNIISWTAMIGGLDQNNQSEKSLQLFKQMCNIGIKATSSTFSCALTACGNASNLKLGIQIHAQLFKTGDLSDSYVTTSLLTFYAKCEQIEISKKIFEEIDDRTVVAWTALITAYNFNGRFENALVEFDKMIFCGVNPNQSTFTSALNSCCGIEALDRGKKIHSRVIRVGLNPDLFVANSLLVMYSKCGDINVALKVFDEMRERNIVSWNSIIVSCAQNGFALFALKLFDEMSFCFVQPDEITYVGVLMACSHARLLEKGKYYFNMLEKDYRIEIKTEHFVCMVDILARCGKLNEAEKFIHDMPLNPNVAIWLTLLSACRVYGNVEMAKRAFKEIIKIDSNNSSAYVLMSNIYATAGRWNDVLQTRVLMRHQGVIKTIGYSWINIRNIRHEFTCGDKSHPMTKEIYEKLDWLRTKLMEHGHVFNKNFALHDLDEEEKETVLNCHSEKIAVAFGLLNTVEGSTIRVLKNLRVCGDCHMAIKIISKIVGREIVLRDSTRFHHFRDGFCSCGDYW